MRCRELVLLWCCAWFGAGAGDGDAGKCAAKCRCRSADGREIDLTAEHAEHPKAVYSALVRSAYNLTDFAVDEYLFHPCDDFDLAQNADVENECRLTSLCRRTTDFVRKAPGNFVVTDHGYDSLGTFEESYVDIAADEVRFVYKQKAITAIVNLVCVERGSSALVVVSKDEKNPVLTFYSPNACLKTVEEPSRRSLGTTLLIVFLVVTLAYLTAGCCVKRFLMGARGVEVVPNLNFWRDLPELVRDGIVFVQNGFKPPARPAASSPNANPNANSYDSI